jgi:hypothetical protein
MVKPPSQIQMISGWFHIRTITPSPEGSPIET